MHRMETAKLAAFPALNLFVEEKNIDLIGICAIFFEHLTTFDFELDWYIPSQNYSQIFNWVPTPFEVSALEIHSQIDCIAKQLIKLPSRQMWRDKLKTVSLTQFGANVQSMKPNLSNLCQQAAVALCLFKQYSYVKPAFQHWLCLKPSTATNCNRKMISHCIDDHDS